MYLKAKFMILVSVRLYTKCKRKGVVCEETKLLEIVR